MCTVTRRIDKRVFNTPKTFKRAFEKEKLTSDVLLQQFITGLLPQISRQLLIEEKPESLNVAIKGAV